MNTLIKAVKALETDRVRELLRVERWRRWTDRNGKNALHFLCETNISERFELAGPSLELLKDLLAGGLEINSIHRIPDRNCGHFPATPLWYAYTRGRNETLYRYLLEEGADPQNCMFAIAWNDDVEAAELFSKYGASRTDHRGRDTPFMASFMWKKFRMTEWFLDRGANVDETDDDGNTALFYAVGLKGKYSLREIELLLRYGADSNLKNKNDLSPKDLARLKGRPDVLAVLKANEERPTEDSGAAEPRKTS